MNSNNNSLTTNYASPSAGRTTSTSTIPIRTGGESDRMEPTTMVTPGTDRSRPVAPQDDDNDDDDRIPSLDPPTTSSSSEEQEEPVIQGPPPMNRTIPMTMKRSYYVSNRLQIMNDICHGMEQGRHANNGPTLSVVTVAPQDQNIPMISSLLNTVVQPTSLQWQQQHRQDPTCHCHVLVMDWQNWHASYQAMVRQLKRLQQQQQGTEVDRPAKRRKIHHHRPLAVICTIRFLLVLYHAPHPLLLPSLALPEFLEPFRPLMDGIVVATHHAYDRPPADDETVFGVSVRPSQVFVLQIESVLAPQGSPNGPLLLFPDPSAESTPFWLQNPGSNLPRIMSPGGPFQAPTLNMEATFRNYQLLVVHTQEYSVDSVIQNGRAWVMQDFHHRFAVFVQLGRNEENNRQALHDAIQHVTQWSQEKLQTYIGDLCQQCLVEELVRSLQKFIHKQWFLVVDLVHANDDEPFATTHETTTPPSRQWLSPEQSHLALCNNGCCIVLTSAPPPQEIQVWQVPNRSANGTVEREVVPRNVSSSPT